MLAPTPARFAAAARFSRCFPGLPARQPTPLIFGTVITSEVETLAFAQKPRAATGAAQMSFEESIAWQAPADMVTLCDMVM